MRYKLIATDMDGTLIRGDHTFSEGNKAAVAAAVAAGVIVVPCSGRSFASLRGFGAELGLPGDGYIIGFNGGAVNVLGTGEIVYEAMLEEGTAREILTFLKGLGGEVLAYKDAYHTLLQSKSVYTDGYSKTSRTTPTYVEDLAACPQLADGVCKILVLGNEKELAGIDAAVKAWGREDFGWVFSAKNLAEFMPPGVSKGAAVTALCGRLGIDMGDVIAIGDQENDLSMIQAAGLGVAMANGTAMVKAAAGYVTQADCEHDGAAEVIRRFVL